MIYLVKLKNGVEFEISQEGRDQITRLLIGPQEKRPEFIEVESVGAVISVSSIAAIIRHRQDSERLPTHDEEMKQFNADWERDHQAAEA